jgi:hypothetical protein
MNEVILQKLQNSLPLYSIFLFSVLLSQSLIFFFFSLKIHLLPILLRRDLNIYLSFKAQDKIPRKKMNI